MGPRRCGRRRRREPHARRRRARAGRRDAASARRGRASSRRARGRRRGWFPVRGDGEERVRRRTRRASWMGGGGGAFGSGIFGGYAGDDIGTGDIATPRHRRGNSVDVANLEDELMALTGGLNLDDDEDEETGIEGGGPSPDGVGIEETGIEGGGRSPDGVLESKTNRRSRRRAPPGPPAQAPTPVDPPGTRRGTRRFDPSQTALATVPGRSGRVRGGRGGCAGPRPRAETGERIRRAGRTRRTASPRAERDDVRGGGEGTRRRREGGPVPLRILLPHHAGCHLRPGDRRGTDTRTNACPSRGGSMEHASVAHDRGDAPGQDPAAQSQHAKPNHRLRRNTPERGAAAT